MWWPVPAELLQAAQPSNIPANRREHLATVHRDVDHRPTEYVFAVAVVLHHDSQVPILGFCTCSADLWSSQIVCVGSITVMELFPVPSTQASAWPAPGSRRTYLRSAVRSCRPLAGPGVQKSCTAHHRQAAHTARPQACRPAFLGWRWKLMARCSMRRIARGSSSCSPLVDNRLAVRVAGDGRTDRRRDAAGGAVGAAVHGGIVGRPLKCANLKFCTNSRCTACR